MAPARSLSHARTRVTAAASLFLVGTGALGLAGWTFDIAALKGLWGPITMKANAAVGLLVCGLGLWLRSSGRPSLRNAGRACVVFAGALGALTLSEHLVGWNLGIDEMLFQETPGAAATVSPGRMGPNAATGLMLAGIALWLLYRGDERSAARAQILGAMIMIFATIPLVGYLYGSTQLYAIARYTGIALHTGIAFLVLSIGVLGARSDTGPVAALTGDAPHAVVARRVLAVAIAIPLILGYFRLLGERLGLYDTAFGASSMVVVTIIMLSAAIWRAAVAQARSEDARAQVQKHRDDLLLSERAARERAERADRAKDEFIAALSHELRTPLNAILGWMQMLQHGAVSGAGREKAIDAVNRNAGLLARLIEDLLDTSRITTGRLELAKAAVDMNVVARAAAESVLPAADAKGVSVTVTPSLMPAVLVGDAQRLQQVIWNLLSNAIKFSPSGGRVSLDVIGDGGFVRVAVRDQGCGIDAEFLPYVFDRFRRDESGSPQGSSGLGLGLYIAKHLTELHGGTIAAESAGVGRGAQFTIQVPVAAGAQLSSAG